MKLFTKGMAETIDNEKMFVASDEVEDRQGEVIMQDGWDLSNYKDNPVIQWAHNSDEPAIATAEKIGFRNINGKKKLVYQPEFHRKTPMSNYIADLVDAGIIKASSVGFKPIEMDENKYTKAELLEISFVNVPANQNALSLALSKGYDEKTIKSVMPDIEIEKVTPYKKYPLSTEKEFEVEKGDAKDMKAMGLDKEGSLIHHELSGYKTNLTGVKKAMAELLKGDGDQKKYDHLVKHYQDFGLEAPGLKTSDEIINQYVEAKSADEKIIELTKTINVFVEEMRQENEVKKEIAEKNTESFQKEIIKRFEDIEFNIQGLSEGIKPSEKGLEQRLSDMEDSVEQISLDIREYLSSQPEGKGDKGREPKMAIESKKDQTGRLALKVLNKSVELLNKNLR